MVTKRTYRKREKDPGPTRSMLYNTKGKSKNAVRRRRMKANWNSI